jgi:hypothetical protein
MWMLVYFPSLLIGRQAVLGRADTLPRRAPRAVFDTASRGDEAETHCPSVVDPHDVLSGGGPDAGVWGKCIDATFIGELSGRAGKKHRPEHAAETSRDNVARGSDGTRRRVLPKTPVRAWARSVVSPPSALPTGTVAARQRARGA